MMDYSLALQREREKERETKREREREREREKQVLENVSATTFNVMGNANKILTLVANHVLWEHHASIQARRR